MQSLSFAEFAKFVKFTMLDEFPTGCRVYPICRVRRWNDSVCPVFRDGRVLPRWPSLTSLPRLPSFIEMAQFAEMAEMVKVAEFREFREFDLFVKLPSFPR